MRYGEKWEDAPRNVAEINARLALPITRDDAHRLAAFNKKAHNASMSASLRWADKLAQAGRKPLPRARWWNGEPFGKPPESTGAWANRLAKNCPPYAFIYDPTDTWEGNTSYVHAVQDGGVRIKRATDPDDARIRFAKLGVPVADL